MNQCLIYGLSRSFQACGYRSQWGDVIWPAMLEILLHNLPAAWHLSNRLGLVSLVTSFSFCMWDSETPPESPACFKCGIYQEILSYSTEPTELTFDFHGLKLRWHLQKELTSESAEICLRLSLGSNALNELEGLQKAVQNLGSHTQSMPIILQPVSPKINGLGRARVRTCSGNLITNFSQPPSGVGSAPA